MEIQLTFLISDTELKHKTVNMTHTDTLSVRKRTCHMYPGYTMKVQVATKKPYTVPSYLR